jgi:hypothetical protein
MLLPVTTFNVKKYCSKVIARGNQYKAERVHFNGGILFM